MTESQTVMAHMSEDNLSDTICEELKIFNFVEKGPKPVKSRYLI